MRNLHKYGFAFQVEGNTNFMRLVFVLQDHELMVKPRTSFRATLSLYMNLSENCAKVEVGGFCWITLCLQDGIKIPILEPISTGLHPWGLNQIKKSAQIHFGWGCQISHSFDCQWQAYLRADHKVSIFQSWSLLLKEI